jgi:hypothetical protein
LITVNFPVLQQFHFRRTGIVPHCSYLLDLRGFVLPLDLRARTGRREPAVAVPGISIGRQQRANA